MYDLSVCQQEQCFTELNVFLRLLPKNATLLGAIASGLTVLRTARPQLYREYVLGRMGAETVCLEIGKQQQREAFLGSRSGATFQGQLRGASLVSHEPQKAMETFMAKIQSYHTPEEGTHAQLV